MKNSLKIFAVAAIGIALTGCSNGKKITCKVEATDSSKGEATQKTTYEYSKDGKNIEKYTKEETYKYNDRYMEYADVEIDDLVEEYEEDCEDYEDYDIVTCKVSSGKNSITQTLTYDLKGLDEDDLEEMYDEKDINYSIYSTAKRLVDKSYDDMKKDINDKDNSLYIYGCK